MKENNHDSVTGGPHRPKESGPGENDSIMYVDYSGKQVLPEFIVTYQEIADGEGPRAGTKRPGELPTGAKRHKPSHGLEVISMSASIPRSS